MTTQARLDTPPLGARVRRLFGPHERLISELWRAAFFDLDAFVDQIHRWQPEARAILEVGCGEGAVAERLTARYPNARYLGVDLCAAPGRLYEGDRAVFRREPVQHTASQSPASFDLVVIADVLHHVPQTERPSLLGALRRACRPGGLVVVKDWTKDRSLQTALALFADRHITQDEDVALMPPDAFRDLLAEAFGDAALTERACIAPWRQNVAWAVRPDDDA